MKLHLLHDWSAWFDLHYKDKVVKAYFNDKKEITEAKFCLICNKTKYRRVKI